MKINLFPENRLIKHSLVIICVIILISSCYYNYSRPMGLLVVMSEPEKNDGIELTISGEVKDINKPFYTLYDGPNNKYFKVKNYITDWSISDMVAMKVKYHKEGYLEYIYGEIIWDKTIKLIISIISLIIFISIFIYEFKKLKFDF